MFRYLARLSAAGRALGAAIAALALVLTAAPAGATILEKLDFDALCGGAGRVVLARCIENSSAWDPPGRTILTTTRFAISETLKGPAEASVAVTALGGTVGDRSMGVAGSPRFNPGEEYVLFLDAVPAGGWMCKGWTQGRYSVVTDPATGAKSVRGDTTGASMMKRGSPKVEEGGRGDSMPLSGFLDAVRAKLSSGGGK